ncbi:MAG TPA: S8 family serine peptidase [Actinomycetota bacterium]|nr:S8 family serine peptidase [Actinomycetota bacterium]
MLVLLKGFVAAVVAAILVAAGAVAPAALASPEPVGDVDPEREHVPGELVVRYASDAERADVREEHGLEKIEPLALPNTELVQVEGASVADAAAAVTAEPDVVYAEPNYVYRAASVPNDPLFPQLWGLHQTSDVDVDAPQAWDVTTGSRSVTVAVVDTGVAVDHPEMAPGTWRNPGETGSGKESNGLDDDGNGYVDDFQGWDWIGDDRHPRDLHGHGTHVAATIGAAGNDGSGIAGLAWSTRIMALRALNSQGAGTTADLTNAFAYAARAGAQVVNVSLGGQGQSLSVLNAIAAAPGTLFVAAAGNAGANNDVASSYPCNYQVPNIVCVAAMDSQDRLASFSNYGATTVDLAAPGTGILSLQPAFDVRFSEDFSNGLGSRWTTGGVNGTWAAGPDGTVADSPGASYLDNADHWLATATPFDLGGMNDCLLRYSMKLDVEEGNDLLAIEASRDGSTWERVGGWTGSTGGAWERVTESLFDYDGAPALHLRFRLISNGSVTRDGATLDAISVRCNSTVYSGQTLYADGTSMATPHVTGAAALAWSAQPGASVPNVVSALLDGAEDRPAYFGKTVSGGRLNACRTVALVASLPVERCADGGGAATPSPTPTRTATPAPTSSPTPSPSPTPTPTATPTATPSPTAPATPTPTPTVTPTPTATPTPTVTPTPTPTATPTPEATPTPDATASPEPEPDPEEKPVYVHVRTVTLGIDDGGVRGRVRSPDGYESCKARVVVRIVRAGRVVARVETRTNGRFRADVPDKPGRYRAVAPQFAPDDANLCERARSKTRRI